MLRVLLSFRRRKSPASPQPAGAGPSAQPAAPSMHMVRHVPDPCAVDAETSPEMRAAFSLVGASVTSPGVEEIDFDSYVSLYMSLFRALAMPGEVFDEADARRRAENDFQRDSAGRRAVPLTTLAAALVSLAGLWVQAEEEAERAAGQRAARRASMEDLIPPSSPSPTPSSTRSVASDPSFPSSGSPRRNHVAPASSSSLGVPPGSGEPSRAVLFLERLRRLVTQEDGSGRLAIVPFQDVPLGKGRPPALRPRPFPRSVSVPARASRRVRFSLPGTGGWAGDEIEGDPTSNAEAAPAPVPSTSTSNPKSAFPPPIPRHRSSGSLAADGHARAGGLASASFVDSPLGVVPGPPYPSPVLEFFRGAKGSVSDRGPRRRAAPPDSVESPSSLPAIGGFEPRPPPIPRPEPQRNGASPAAQSPRARAVAHTSSIDEVRQSVAARLGLPPVAPLLPSTPPGAGDRPPAPAPRSPTMLVTPPQGSVAVLSV
eukprot:tig00000178_g12764.t1